MTDAGALTIEAVHDGRICVLTLCGALDLTTAAGFLEHVARAVDDRTERIALDLAGLAHLDCAGARALVLAAYAAPDGCPVIVCSISPPAARLVDLLNRESREPWQYRGAGRGADGTPARQAQPAGPHSAERPHTRNVPGPGDGGWGACPATTVFVPEPAVPAGREPGPLVTHERLSL